MKLAVAALVVGMLLVAARPAMAAPDARTTPTMPAAPAPASSGRQPATATTLSVGVTVVGLGVAILGLVDPWKEYLLVDGRIPCCPQRSAAGWTLLAVGTAAFVAGPTTGHVYAGKTWNVGLGLRVAALGGGLLGGAMLAGADSGNIFCQGTACEAGVAFVVISGVLYVVGTGVEIGTAAGAVRRERARWAPQVGLGVLRAGDRTLPALSISGAL